jgi:hypothetical protein
MSDQQGPASTRPPRSLRGCEWCIYGTVHWFVSYAIEDGLWDYEAELCDRCMEDLRERRESGLASIWSVEET